MTESEKIAGLLKRANWLEPAEAKAGGLTARVTRPERASNVQVFAPVLLDLIGRKGRVVRVRSSEVEVWALPVPKDRRHDYSDLGAGHGNKILRTN